MNTRSFFIGDLPVITIILDPAGPKVWTNLGGIRDITPETVDVMTAQFKQGGMKVRDCFCVWCHNPAAPMPEHETSGICAMHLKAEQVRAEERERRLACGS